MHIYYSSYLGRIRLGDIVVGIDSVEHDQIQPSERWFVYPATRLADQTKSVR